MRYTRNAKGFKIDEAVLVDTAPLVASNIPTNKYIPAVVKDVQEHACWIFTPHGSPLWVSNFFIKHGASNEIHQDPDRTHPHSV